VLVRRQPRGARAVLYGKWHGSAADGDQKGVLVGGLATPYARLRRRRPRARKAIACCHPTRAATPMRGGSRNWSSPSSETIAERLRTGRYSTSATMSHSPSSESRSRLSRHSTEEDTALPRPGTAQWRPRRVRRPQRTRDILVGRGFAQSLKRSRFDQSRSGYDRSGRRAAATLFRGGSIQRLPS